MDTVDRTATAVQKAFSCRYEVVIIDFDAIGLSASNAADVILRSCEGTRVIIAGGNKVVAGAANVEKPLVVEDVSRLVRSLCEPSLTK